MDANASPDHNGAFRNRVSPMQRRDHWEGVYTSKATDAVSWYQAHAQRSLDMIEACGLDVHAPIIDVGGGASTLVDDLLARGFENLSVLDISEAALAASRARLGARSEAVTWHVADITRADLPQRAFALWHDRAVFHFLTEASDRDAYRATLHRALRPGGHVLIATFAEDGPTRCSGLPVCRYDAAGLAAELGPAFRLVGSTRELHRTPFATEQAFTFCHFQALA